MQKRVLPIAFPKQVPLRPGDHIMAADIGGTKTDLAFFVVEDDTLLMWKSTVLPSEQFCSPAAMLDSFMHDEPRPKRLCVAFAGPVRNGIARATNLNIQIDAAKLGAAIGVPQVFLINDLEAEAYGLAGLRESELRTICRGAVGAAGNAAILAPGTGLGEAGLYWDGAALHPFATEGGHTGFVPRDAFDWQLHQHLQKKYGHVSWERVLSGPGLEHIFCFLRDVENWEIPDSFCSSLKCHSLPEAIGLAAETGSPVCQEAQRHFVRYLAEEASNLALKFKATGGIFLGGGILPKIWNEQLEALFIEHFVQVGRMRPLLESVPAHLILNPKTAVLGAALYALGDSSRQLSIHKNHAL